MDYSYHNSFKLLTFAPLPFCLSFLSPHQPIFSIQYVTINSYSTPPISAPHYMLFVIRDTIHEPRFTNHAPRTTNYQLQTINYQLQTPNYKLPTTRLLL